MVWDNLIKINGNNTRARKMQIKNERNTFKRSKQAISKYLLNIKSLRGFLVSIGVIVDDDDKTEACLRGLGNAYKQFKTSIKSLENIPNSQELTSMMVVEKSSLIEGGIIWSTIKILAIIAFYIGSSRGRGHGSLQVGG